MHPLQVDDLQRQLADKCDGSEKEWPNWSFVMKAYDGAIDQELSTDMDRCRDQYGCVEQRRHDARQEIQECAVVISS